MDATDPAGSRYCPHCLDDPDPWWHADWANPLLPICLRHRVYLRTVCPGCGQMPWTGTTWMGNIAVPWRCPQRQPRGPAQRPGRVRPLCRYDLRDVPALSAPEKMCTAQQNLIEFAALADQQPSRHLRYGTVDIPITEALDRLCQRFAVTVRHSLEAMEQFDAR